MRRSCREPIGGGGWPSIRDASGAKERAFNGRRVRPAIYFADDPASNGKRSELTAEDYVYSIKRLFDPRRKSPNLYQLEGTIVGMDEVLAKARKTNVMDFDTPVEG